MLTTIFVDASFDHKTRTAGYGCWMKNTAGTWERNGPFKDHVSTSCDAEILAILNALFLAERLTESTRYHVVSDCSGAIDILSGKTRRETNRRHREKLIEIVGGKSITFAHVKAHTGNSDARSWVNNQVDKAAKAGRKEALKILGPCTKKPETRRGPAQPKPLPFALLSKKGKKKRLWKERKAEKKNLRRAHAAPPQSP